MKYIGYLEIEAGKTGRLMEKIVEEDHPLTVLKIVWELANKKDKVGFVYAELEPNVFQQVAVIIPVGYRLGVSKDG